MGGVKSPLCNGLAKQIWLWCIKENFWITATHIAGKLNVEADRESRKFNDHVEWHLEKQKFTDICRIMDTPEIDLFASRLNYQLPVYCSWKCDPESTYVDAFTLNWSEFYAYLFPPFSLIGQCVKKIIEDESEAVFVAPLWPTQTWFVQLLRLLVQTPVILIASDTLMTLSYKKDLHPLRIFFKSDGLPGVREQYEKRGISKNTTEILLASWRDGTKKQYQVYIKKWLFFCCQRQTNQIQCSLVDVLDFMTMLFHKGLSYSALNSARSALSALGLCFDNTLVGRHPTIIRFMRGVYNLRPTIQNNVHIWDVSVVLRFLKTLSPVPQLSLKNLTLKLVMLISLTNATSPNYSFVKH